MGVYGFGLGTIVAASMTMLAESGVEMTGSRAAGQNVATGHFSPVGGKRGSVVGAQLDAKNL